MSETKLPVSVTIGPFRVEAGQYVRPMLRMFFGRNWMWFALPLLAAGATAICTADVRWAIVGLILLFMVFPMIMVLIYINYALTLEVRWSLMEKTMHIDGDGVHMSFADARMRDRSISWNDISSITRDRNAFYLHLKVRRFNYVMIPCSALIESEITEQYFTQCVKGWFASQSTVE